MNLKRHLVAFLVLCSLFGTLAHADSTTTGGDRVIENPTSDGDIVFRVNDGGTKTEVMRLDGATSQLVLTKSTQHTICNVVNADYTLTTTDGCAVVQFNTGTPNRTLTLGAASSFPGRRISVKKINSDLGHVSLAVTGDISGYSTTQSRLYTNGAFAVVYSDGTNWYYEVEPSEAGSWTPTASNTVNLDATPTCNLGWFARVGRTVNAGWRCSTDVNTGSVVSVYRVTTPVGAGNFGNSDRAFGTCVTDAGTANLAPTAWYIQSVAATTTLIVETAQSNVIASARNVICNVTYKVE